MTPDADSRHISTPVARAIQLILTVAVPLLLVMSGVRLVMTPLFLNIEYNWPDFPEDFYGFSKADRLQYAPYALQYLLNGEGINYLGDLTLPHNQCFNTGATSGQCPMYTEGELAHMRDVKTLTGAAYLITVVMALVAAVGAALLWRDNSTRDRLRRGLRNGALLTLALILLIVAGAVTAWNTFFDTFHEIFFKSGTWRFSYSDTLIRLFPEQFWFDAALTIGAVAVLGSVIILATTWWWGRRQS